MTWARFSDDWSEREDVLDAGPEVAWFHVTAVLYAMRNLTDGYLRRDRLGAMSNVTDPSACAERLVELGLWSETAVGYRIEEFLERHGRAREQVEAERARKAENQRAYMDRKRADRITDRSATRSADRPPAPPRPVGARAEVEGEQEERPAPGGPTAPPDGSVAAALRDWFERRDYGTRWILDDTNPEGAVWALIADRTDELEFCLYGKVGSDKPPRLSWCSPVCDNDDDSVTEAIEAKHRAAIQRNLRDTTEWIGGRLTLNDGDGINGYIEPDPRRPVEDVTTLLVAVEVAFAPLCADVKRGAT